MMGLADRPKSAKANQILDVFITWRVSRMLSAEQWRAHAESGLAEWMPDADHRASYLNTRRREAWRTRFKSPKVTSITSQKNSTNSRPFSPRENGLCFLGSSAQPARNFMIRFSLE